MTIKSTGWPKILPPLTPAQEQISNDFMAYWHETLASQKRYGAIEKFNHGYPVKHTPNHFVSTLEIGAGQGEQLAYEKLSLEQQANYVALELRENMAASIREKFPTIKTLTADCQQRLPFTDNSFDRILAIHVLEHLPNLPATIQEAYRLCRPNGFFSVVIPCEGGLLYSLARKISAQRIFEKRYKQSYKWFIEREHLNTPSEILKELSPYFKVHHQSFFPFIVPSINFNLCIGLTLTPIK